MRMIAVVSITLASLSLPLVERTPRRGARIAASERIVASTRLRNAWLLFRAMPDFARAINSRTRIGPAGTRAGAISAIIRNTRSQIEGNMAKKNSKRREWTKTDVRKLNDLQLVISYSQSNNQSDR
jgi:hypothetical protein